MQGSEPKIPPVSNGAYSGISRGLFGAKNERGDLGDFFLLGFSTSILLTGLVTLFMFRASSRRSRMPGLLTTNSSARAAFLGLFSSSRGGAWPDRSSCFPRDASEGTEMISLPCRYLTWISPCLSRSLFSAASL